MNTLFDLSIMLSSCEPRLARMQSLHSNSSVSRTDPEISRSLSTPPVSNTSKPGYSERSQFTDVSIRCADGILWYNRYQLDRASNHLAHLVANPQSTTIATTYSRSVVTAVLHYIDNIHASNDLWVDIKFSMAAYSLAIEWECHTIADQIVDIVLYHHRRSIDVHVLAVLRLNNCKRYQSALAIFTAGNHTGIIGDTIEYYKSREEASRIVHTQQNDEMIKTINQLKSCLVEIRGVVDRYYARGRSATKHLNTTVDNVDSAINMC